MNIGEGEASVGKIPEWYCPYKLPAEFIGSIPPLVCLAGLEIEGNQVHRGIWEMIKLKPSAKDFQPTYVDVPLSFKLPVKKPKNEHIESYTPRGILKSNWLNKHMQIVPSVVVIFFDMNWTDQSWNEKKNECAARIRELKTDLSPHGTQILVMLIKTMDSGEHNFSTDRASALCAAADIAPKTLYILSHTHTERIQACVQRLEIGMKEASKIYYSARIRRVKNWKDRAQNIALLARYNFKIGFFQEIRRDYVSALSHYHTAHEGLRSLKMTESNIQQIRSMTSWINYRICRLNLLKLDYKESVDQFEKHIQTIGKSEGHSDIIFEHYAWLQHQYSYFGELLRHFYRPGLTSLDPVTYYLRAVEYSQKREHHSKSVFQSSPDELVWPENMQEFIKNDTEYIGQRPWRQDSFGPDTVFVPEDPSAMQALKYLETQYEHSKDRITYLGTASDFCRDQQRMRTRCQLMMMMGVEFFTQREYHRSVMLMTHVLREFGRDKGSVLLYLVADCGLRAACCEGDVASYLGFLVFLLKQDFERLVPPKRREMLWSNFSMVLDRKMPVAETDCVPSEEKWKVALSAPFVSYVGVHRDCVVEASYSFASDTFRASSPAEVRVVLTNKADHPVSIRKCGVGISINDYNCESVCDITLQPGIRHDLSLFFTPMMRDAGKIIQIHVGFVDIGKADSSVLLHYSAVLGATPCLWTDGKEDKGKQIIAKIEQTQQMLRPIVTRNDPMLVNEWHKVVVKWTNTDTFTYSKVNFTFLVDAADPRDVVLTSDPKTARTGNMTHSVDVDQLTPSDSFETVIYIKCESYQTSELQFITKAKYADHLHQIIMNDHVEPIEVTRPFEISQRFYNLQTDELESVLANEEFAGSFMIKNLSKFPLKIVRAKVCDVSSLLKSAAPCSEINDLVILENEVVQGIDTIVMTSPGDKPMRRLELTWKRHEEDVPACTMHIPISPLVSVPESIYVEGIFSNKGGEKLKKPMPIKYTVHNRSNKMYNLWVSLDSTECFMNAGLKKTNIKIAAQEYTELNYVLFPLKTGLLKTPRLLIESAKTSDTGGVGEAPPVVHRNVVRHIFVTRTVTESDTEETVG